MEGWSRRRRIAFLSLVAVVQVFASAGCDSSGAVSSSPRHEVLQVSTLGALRVGVYAGAFEVGRLSEHGNFGLGTFDRLDGEMVVLDGVVYQVGVDGVPRVAAGDGTTPFAVVVEFSPDQLASLERGISFEELQAEIDGHLASVNVPVAIRIHGTHPSLHLRSVPAQERPFPPLEVVIGEQVEFERRDLVGTLVGFRFPAAMADLNVAGHHFHFVSDDRLHGGHVLGGEIDAREVEIAYLRDVRLWLPESPDFDSAVVGSTE